MVGVSRRKGFYDSLCSILGTAVIHGNHFPIRVSLRADGFQRLTDESPHFIAGHDHAHQGLISFFGHSFLKITSYLC
jgi:hypothetical protein